jgi:hypothetical protein
MEWVMFLCTALLFFLLTPGILVTLPPKGKKITVAVVHAVLFGLLFALSHKTLMRLSY